MASRCARVLDELEKLYGTPAIGPASDPYEMLVLANSGYPASEASCAKGFAALRAQVGTARADILRAPKKRLVAALRAGGIIPELRADRLREIATAVVHEYGGDLAGALADSLPPRLRRGGRQLVVSVPVSASCVVRGSA